jgi:hypothetical protein
MVTEGEALLAPFGTRQPRASAFGSSAAASLTRHAWLVCTALALVGATALVASVPAGVGGRLGQEQGKPSTLSLLIKLSAPTKDTLIPFQ